MKLHQCVRLGSSLEIDNKLSFIPPDGESVLLDYVLSPDKKPPIQIKTVVAPCVDPSRKEYSVRLSSCFEASLAARDVEVKIPLPTIAHNPDFETAVGSARYDRSQNLIVWQVKRLQGQQDLILTINFGPTSQNNLDPPSKAAPAVNVRFKIPGLSASGLRISYLKIIEKSGYDAKRSIQYLTDGEDCQYRFRQ